MQTYRDLKDSLLEIERYVQTPLEMAIRCLEVTIYELAKLKKDIDPETGPG